MALLALAAGLALPPAAHAGRPLVTEDANVLAPGECELESFLASARRPATDPTRTGSVQVGCGVGGATQLALQGVRARGGEPLDTVALVGKTALRAPGDQRAGFTLAYALGADRPRNEPDWRRFRQESATVLSVLSAPLSPATVHANLGWTRQRSTGANTMLWALAVERSSAIAGVDLMAETLATTAIRPGWQWPRAGPRSTAS